MINNPYGLERFGAYSLFGLQRTTLYSETVLFLQGKILGFRLAPYAFGNLTMLTPENASVKKSDLYSGIGGGIRVRNENLIFGTIELRMIYFPRKAQINTTPFKITIHSNLRFRY